MLKKLIIALVVSVCFSAMAQTEELPIKVINGVSYHYYEVPAKATIYSITRKYGITREELFKYNPQIIDGLRAGDILLFPTQNQNINNIQPEQQQEEATTDATEPEEIATQPIVKEETVLISPVISNDSTANNFDDYINVGIILPFMLDAEGITRQSQNQTDFYRGALLAVNNSATSNNKFAIYAYDTDNDIEKLRNILTKPEIQKLDYIIAPGDTLSLETIAEMADSTEAVVINLFGVKNDAHLHHQSVFQANIPHDAMYARAQEAFCNEYKDYKVLIVNATDIPADKKTFTDELTNLLIRSGIPYEQINFSGKLSPDDLSSLPERNYVIVPTSASRELLLKILPTLTEFADSNPEMDIRMFGYPEWVVLRGNIKDKLHKLNTIVYSRFSTDLDGQDVTSVQADYKKWYGEESQPSLPDIMLLGYDTIAWILHTVDKGWEIPYVGLQNSFKIIDLDDVGSVNNALYFITFNQKGQVEARSL